MSYSGVGQAYAFAAQGFAVQVEKALGKGKSVDLEARRDGKRIAVEVETGKSDAIQNVRKDMEPGYDQILVVCLDDGVKQKMQVRLEGVHLSRKD